MSEQLPWLSLLFPLMLGFGQQRLNRQSLAAESLTTEVTRKRAAKSPARLGTVPRQSNRRPPQPRAQRHMTRKSGGTKAPVAGHKLIHGRQSEIGDIGDGFQNPELCLLYTSRCV